MLVVKVQFLYDFRHLVNLSRNSMFYVGLAWRESSLKKQVGLRWKSQQKRDEHCWPFANISSSSWDILFQSSRFLHMEDAMTVTFWMETRPKWRHNCSIETKWKFFSFYNSENHEHNRFKFSGIILFFSSNQNKWITLLPWQPKKQYSPLNLAAETAIIAHVESISKMW